MNWKWKESSHLQPLICFAIVTLFHAIYKTVDSQYHLYHETIMTVGRISLTFNLVISNRQVLLSCAIVFEMSLIVHYFKIRKEYPTHQTLQE